MEERLQKLISRAGVASRRKAEELITQGMVSVNGEVVTELGTKADSQRDAIKVQGKLLFAKPPKPIYLAMYKPRGVVTTTDDPEGRPTVVDLLGRFRGKVYPVGRLDYGSEGLLLLTNDGEFTNRVTAAKSLIPKTYEVKSNRSLNASQLDRFREGVVLDGRRTAPAKIRLIKAAANPWYQVTLIEGRNRQIRKMFLALGVLVEKIKRTRIGPQTLGRMKSGEVRELTEKELERFERVFRSPQELEGRLDTQPKRSQPKREGPPRPSRQRSATARDSRPSRPSGSRPSGPRPTGQRSDAGHDSRPPRPSGPRSEAPRDSRPPRPSGQRSGPSRDSRPPRPSGQRSDAGRDSRPPRSNGSRPAARGESRPPRPGGQWSDAGRDSRPPRSSGSRPAARGESRPPRPGGQWSDAGRDSRPPRSSGSRPAARGESRPPRPGGGPWSDAGRDSRPPRSSGPPPAQTRDSKPLRPPKFARLAAEKAASRPSGPSRGPKKNVDRRGNRGAAPKR